MEDKSRITLEEFQLCPHCRSKLLVWDRDDQEPFCFICGWRRSVKITAEESKLRKKHADWAGLLRSKVF